MSADLRLLWESAGGNAPKQWEFKAIEGLLEHSKSISVGVMYPGKDSEEGVPLVKVSDVKNGAIAKKPEFCISEKIDEEYKRTRLNGTELLITLVGNPGDCVVVNDEMAGWNVARALAVVRLTDIELRSWLRYVLLSKPAKHLIDARLNTTVQKTLNLKNIRELGVPIPPKEEREKITNIIDAFESKVLINHQTNQTLEQIAQAIFKSWFVDFEPVKAKIKAKQTLTPTLSQREREQVVELAAMCAISGKTEEQLKGLDKDALQQLKTTVALFPDALVESELGEIPEGWRYSEIGNEVTVVGGGTPSTKITAFWEGGHIHWTSPRDMSNLTDKILLYTDRKITESGLSKISSGLLPKNTVLMSSRAPVGYLAIAKVPVAINQGYIAMKCESDLTPEYVVQWAESIMGEIKQRASGTTFAENK